MPKARIDIDLASLDALRWPALCMVTGTPVVGPVDIAMLAPTVRRTPELALPLIPKYAERMRKSVRRWRRFVRVGLPIAVSLGVAGLVLVVVGALGVAGSQSRLGAGLAILGMVAMLVGSLLADVMAVTFVFRTLAQHPRRWRGRAVIQKAHPAFTAEFVRLNGALPGVRVS